MPYRVLDHTADFMVEVSGRSLPELFTEAARALFETLADLGTVRPLERRTVRVEAGDTEELLVAWLTELLVLHEAEGWLFSRFDLPRIGGGRLEAEVWGERFDPGRHAIDREVKAITYHRLGVEREGDLFKTAIVFDL